MNKPAIAVDIDDVLSLHAAAFVQFTNQQWGHQLTAGDYDEHWGRMWGLEDQDEVAHRADLVHDSGLYGGLMHDDSAAEILKKLKTNFKLVIITSRRRSIQQETLAWVEDNFPEIFDGVYFAGIWDKLTATSHTMTKADLCKELGVSYLIDDQLKHCLAAAAQGVETILFGDYNWNKAEQLPKGVTRCHNWYQVEAYFNGRIQE